MLLRHHEKTQELEYRQQKAVHQLREEQVQRQHDTELHNQHEYMQRAQRELRKKHALQLKQQPKSLKVKATHPLMLVFFSVIPRLAEEKNTPIDLFCCSISQLHYICVEYIYIYLFVQCSLCSHAL